VEADSDVVVDDDDEEVAVEVDVEEVGRLMTRKTGVATTDFSALSSTAR
jgi:hypothetical protein